MPPKANQTIQWQSWSSAGVDGFYNEIDSPPHHI